jgi:Retrotransposon gag protein
MEATKAVAPSSLYALPIFEPQLADATQWLDTLEELASLFAWSDTQKLLVARCRLGPDARVWETGLRQQLQDYQSFSSALLDRFATRHDELYNRLVGCIQSRGESVRSYADRFRNLMAKLHLQENDTNLTYMYQFLRGLVPKVYKTVWILEPRDLSDAIRLAQHIGDGLDHAHMEKNSGAYPAAQRYATATREVHPNAAG